MSKRKTITVTPSARRLVSSLRNIGYDPTTAVADLVDNSISAGASRVEVLVDYNDSQPKIAIVDDGTGMTGGELEEALRFGSRRDYDQHDLGRFGLGMKTASLSLGRRVSVATRKAEKRVVVHAATLDLDHVLESDQWEILSGNGSLCERFARPFLEQGPGTIVVIDRLDRVLPEDLSSGWARRRFDQLAARLATYLGVVFHRFIEGDTVPAVTILVNGEKVDPWNPFAPGEPETRMFGRQLLELSSDGFADTVVVRPYILPPRNKFSSASEFERLGGLRRWNGQQGFYIYRANRLVQSGGWAGLRAADEHTKLARIAVDFETRMDEDFKIDVAKMKVSIPSQLRKNLERVANETCREAEHVYRHSTRDAPESSGHRAERTETSIPTKPLSEPSMEAEELTLALAGAAARVGETEALVRIMKDLAVTNPSVAARFGICID